jgi:pyridoxal phosphate enzyme (YggS family)
VAAFVNAAQRPRPDGSRRDEIAAGLDSVRRRIAAACEEGGRWPDEVRLIVVTKTFPAEDVRILADLGVGDVGENRHQEAVGKHAECAGLGLTWHFVGALQTNKAAAVAEYADVVHSVDRQRLVRALGKAAERTGRTLRCLVQVDLDESGAAEGRSGARPDDVPELAAALAAHPRLEVAGVMGVAPLGEDPEPAFARLAEVAARLRSAHPSADMVSAGMSGDLEAAVRHGATHVRVGTAVLGKRPPLR